MHRSIHNNRGMLAKPDSETILLCPVPKIIPSLTSIIFSTQSADQLTIVVLKSARMVPHICEEQQLQLVDSSEQEHIPRKTTAVCSVTNFRATAGSLPRTFEWMWVAAGMDGRLDSFPLEMQSDWKAHQAALSCKKTEHKMGIRWPLRQVLYDMKIDNVCPWLIECFTDIRSTGELRIFKPQVGEKNSRTRKKTLDLCDAHCSNYFKTFRPGGT